MQVAVQLQQQLQRPMTVADEAAVTLQHQVMLLNSSKLPIRSLLVVDEACKQ